LNNNVSKTTKNTMKKTDNNMFD